VQLGCLTILQQDLPVYSTDR